MCVIAARVFQDAVLELTAKTHMCINNNFTIVTAQFPVSGESNAMTFLQ
jgi:hypothetical protein